jgi:hypothetical protein
MRWQVGDALDPQQIADAVRGLSGRIGPVQRLIGALEQLQVPLARVRGALGIPGMDEDTALNVREKSRMKSVLRSAGIPCGRHQLVTRTEEATSFLAEVGPPMVAKPPAGAGAQATYRLDTTEDFASWLRAAQANPAEVWLLEEFLTGRVHTFDSVTIEGNTLWASISDDQPPPLDGRAAAGHRRCRVRLDQTDRPSGFACPRRTDRVHPHGMVRASRRIGSGVRGGCATSRCPAGSMIGFSHDIDFYSMWAELVLLGTFNPPDRVYATGTAYLRGQGRGRVRTVRGVDEMQRELGHLVVDARLPRPGQPASTSYEGEGFVTVRHEDTAVVRAALDRIISELRVELVEAE